MKIADIKLATGVVKPGYDEKYTTVHVTLEDGRHHYMAIGEPLTTEGLADGFGLLQRALDKRSDL